MGSWCIKREGQLSLGQIYISKMLLILLFQKLYACVKSLENCQLLPVHNIFTLRGNTAQNSWNSYIFIPNKEFYSLPFWYWLQQITIAIRSLQMNFDACPKVMLQAIVHSLYIQQRTVPDTSSYWYFKRIYSWVQTSEVTLLRQL